MRIGVVEVFGDDQDKARAFYTDPGMCSTFIRTGGPRCGC
jgi:hypothetical protein